MQMWHSTKLGHASITEIIKLTTKLSNQGSNKGANVPTS